MFDKLEKILYFYVFILYIIFEVAVIGIFFLGPNTVRGHISRIDLDKIIEHLTDIYWARAFPFKYNIGMVIDNLKRIN